MFVPELHTQEDNRLLPTQQDLALLANSITTGNGKNPSLLTCEEWVNELDQHPDDLKKRFFGLDRELYQDQFDRVEKLMELVELSGLPVNIIYMDGHGRITYLIIKALMERGISNYTLGVVEIDSIVHAWHEAYFPCDIYKIKGDVFDMVGSLIDPSQIVLYLNFCSLGNQCSRLIDLIDQWKGNFMLSTAIRSPVRRDRRRKGSELNNLYFKLSDEVCGPPVAKRKVFYTWARIGKVFCFGKTLDLHI